ncbi:hypothetical protein [Halomicronema hongdechloris]|uniref:hypothetical protein n=1 Tax=Halomicronema hongdechloris TaxID=1209493 RepID=UPI0016517A80|nr:hypothetical protein [Halomicronema hongdechloris]
MSTLVLVEAFLNIEVKAQTIPHSTIIDLSCSDDTPVTRTQIESIRARPGIVYKDATTLELAFEAFALESAYKQKSDDIFYSPRADKNVMPDAVTTFIYINLNPFRFRVYYPGVFIDAKSGRSRIMLSSGNNQTLGFIDHLANVAQIGREGFVLPQLRYLTVGDTVIGNSTIAEAQKEGVMLMQRIACNNPGGAIGVDEFYMGRLVTLESGQVFSAGRPGTMFRNINPLPPPNPY